MTDPNQPQSPKKKTWLPWALGGVGLIALVTAIGGGETTSTIPAAAPIPTVAVTTNANPEAAARASAEASAKAEVDRSASAKAEADKAVAATQEFSGTGDDVVIFNDFRRQAVVVSIKHTGSSNFAVWSVDGQGENIDLLVNEIGKYSGVVPLNFDSDPAGLKITAGGSWTVTTAPVSSVPSWDGSTQYNGKGDAVVRVQGAAKGLTPVNITNTGSGNFSVWAWAEDDRDLLVNEIGDYNGRMLLPGGTILLAVSSDGSWTLAK